MKKALIICLLSCFSMVSQTEDIFVKDAEINEEMIVKGSKYSRDHVYLVNDNYVVYQYGTKRKIIKADMKTFRVVEHNSFALDKNGVYFEGELLKVATKGFEILSVDGSRENIDILWKTDEHVFKNTNKIEVNSKNFKKVQGGQGYWKDNNSLYHYSYDGKKTTFFKVKGFDISSIKVNEAFISDKNNLYIKGNKILYKNEKVERINDYFYKTSKYVLRYKSDKFEEIAGVDVSTLEAVSDSYVRDKNHIYYKYDKLPVKKENLRNVKVFRGPNRLYLSDGKNIYYRTELNEDLDAQTFGMFPNSDFCFDKNGIYIRVTELFKNIVINKKLDFKYKKPVTLQNSFITKNGYLVHDKQVYGSGYKFYMLDITNEELKNAKGNKFYSPEIKDSIVEEYNYNLKKSSTTLYFDGKNTGVDANNFTKVTDSYVLYKDKKNCYYSGHKSLNRIVGMDSEMTKGFNGFCKDKDNLYIGITKIIKSKNVEVLAMFDGYRMGCSQTRSVSDYYLLKNVDGYWLVCASNKITKKFLGKTLANQKEWAPNLKVKFKE